MTRAEAAAARARLLSAVTGRRAAWLGTPALGVAILVLLAETLPPYWVFLAITAAVSAVALLGLGVVSGSAGMISLCQLEFAAVGGWMVAKLNEVAFPGGLLVWILVGGLATVPFGILIGLPALRLRGVHLAVVTLGFAAAVDSVVDQIGFPGSARFLPVARPALFASDKNYFLMSGLVFIVIAVALTAVGRSRAGAAWRVVRFSERATAAAGYSVARTKLTAFAISAFIAGVSGGLLAGQVGLLAAQSFSVSQSLLLYVLAMMLGTQYVDGAVAGGVISMLVTGLLTRFNVNQNWAGVLFGAGAFQALATGSSLSEDLRLRIAARARRRGSEPAGGPVRDVTLLPALAASAPPAADPSLLAVRGLSVRYGAVTALDSVDLTVPSGVVMGLIGPNGAGKSTLADAVTGFIGHAEGTVRLGGVSLDGQPVRARARAGLRRTFQQSRVPPSLTVQGSVVVREVSMTVGHGRVLTLLGPNGAGKTTLLEALAGVIGFASGTASLDGADLGGLSRPARARAGLALVEQGRTVFGSLTVAENIRVAGGGDAALTEYFDLFPPLRARRDVPAALLSGGEQQMLVLARALARRPTALLIDEMSLGLAPVIVRRLLPAVRALADDGMAVLLVEQFATLALGVADDAAVLSGGRVTFAGPAAELEAAPARLHQAYLGSPGLSTGRGM